MSLYAIIIGLFIVFGLLVTVWGLRVLKKSRLRLQWPTVRGEIVTSELQSEDDPLLPLIEYRFHLSGQDIQSRLDFPAATSPSEELSQLYVARYPRGAAVMVYYQTDNPRNSTLEPTTQGDWLILAIGIVTTVFGIIFFIAPLI